MPTLRGEQALTSPENNRMRGWLQGWPGAAQPATGGKSTRHDRRCFGRMEHEDQRLKKHYDRWMDIVRSLELESFILTKLTKPFVPVNLVGPQVSLPPRWVPASRGSIHFLCVIRRHFRWVRADSGGNVFSRNTVARPVGPSSQGETIFFAKYWWLVRWVPAVRWRNNYFARNKEALPCGCRGPSCQPLHDSTLPMEVVP